MPNSLLGKSCDQIVTFLEILPYIKSSLKRTLHYNELVIWLLILEAIKRIGLNNRKIFKQI